MGFALAPIFEKPKELWESVGLTSRFTDTTYKPVVFTIVEGIGEAGKTTAFVRRGSEKYDENPNSFVAISTRCAHLGCPVRYVAAPRSSFVCPCHGGVYDFQGKVDRRAPRCGRSTASRPGCGTDQVQIGPRYSVTSQLQPRLGARDPGEFTSAGIWEYLYPPRPSTRRRHRRTSDEARRRPPIPAAAREAAEAGPTAGNGAQPSDVNPAVDQRQRRSQRRPCVGWVDERTGATGFLTGMLYRKVPKGTNWFYTLGSATALRFRRPGGHGRVPRDVLRPVAHPGLRLA